MAGLADLTAAVHRLADLLEKKDFQGVGPLDEPLYKAAPALETDIVDETTMAQQLGIPRRTLGRYRRQGKFPNCWIKNGKRIRWRVADTLEVWRRGLP